MVFNGSRSGMMKRLSARPESGAGGQNRYSSLVTRRQIPRKVSKTPLPLTATDS